uniref:mannose-6-phosphate isomerase n=1 Tax=Meloidogyne enterolobii TaxID=390850 RepID=A0A6V7XGM2_MELEN|nr:unnamed protein product [Meloidogyne enterolobii]
MKRLDCKALHYQWGRKGAESTVAQLRKDTIEEDEFYAELWMGTHARGPSQVKEGEARIPLADYFRDHPDVLGQHERDGVGLQFLLKVLSVGKCLSLQLHPTREQARELHAADQTNYPDANHKPELTIALTNFEILCGFQMPDTILNNLRSHEALVELLGEKVLSSFGATTDEEEKKGALKNIFTQIWTIPPEEIGTLLTKLLSDIFLKEQRSQTDELIMGLSEHFPEDIGILAPLFLNYVKLKPGQATFLGPNEPHSYLSGDCIECMAQSDNTVRAGLTPKFKNVPLFCENLTYRMGGPPIFEPQHLADGVDEYSPEVQEFSVHKLNKEVSVVQPIAAASILIVVNGSATILPNEGNEEKIEKGDVLLLPQQLGAKLNEKSDDFLAFRAYTPPPKEK